MFIGLYPPAIGRRKVPLRHVTRHIDPSRRHRQLALSRTPWPSWLGQDNRPASLETLQKRTGALQRPTK